MSIDWVLPRETAAWSKHITDRGLARLYVYVYTIKEYYLLDKGTENLLLKEYEMQKKTKLNSILYNN